MTKQVYEQECPACGAMMRFDPVSGKLICDYCGTTVEITPASEVPADAPEENDYITTGFDFQKLRGKAVDLHAMELPVYNCVSCGAEIIAPAEQMALTCPYCRNNIVLTGKTTGNLRPDKVLPFKFSSNQLPAMMKEFYKDKKLLPKDFFGESRMKNITGVYVPFWLFSGRVHADMTYTGNTVFVTESGDTEYTTTRHYRLENSANMSFVGLPVDASGRIDDDRMDALEPFDMSEAKPFDMSYLAGFTADRFDVAADDMAARAEKRMEKTARAIAVRHVKNYTSVTATGGRINASGLDAQYALLPVYMFDLTYGNKKYPFAVNGQTGKIIGEVPTSKEVSTEYWLKHFAPVAAVIIIFFIVKYLVGA